MSVPARRVPLPTVEDYLELEATSTYRHEYIDGHIFAMGDATVRHNELVLNIATNFKEATRSGTCKVRMIEIMLRVSESRFYYPDILVACSSDALHDRAVVDPCVVIEVLSPSTEQIDQRGKLFAYKTIKTLRAYYVVHQDSMTVENYWRDDDGTWWHGTLHGGGALHVPCLNIDLPLAEIYEGVTFDGD